MTENYYPEKNVGRGLPLDYFAPQTPDHCPICGQRIQRVDSEGIPVRGWRSRTIFLEHCEQKHPDYGDWLNKWRGINGYFFLPALLIAIAGLALRSIPIVAAAFAFFIALSLTWFFHSQKVVTQFKGQWQQQHGTRPVAD